MWLELPGHENSEYVKKKYFFNMPVNKMATQNVWQDHFLLPRALLEVGKTVAQIWSHVVGIAAIQEFYKNGRFITAPASHT